MYSRLETIPVSSVGCMFAARNINCYPGHHIKLRNIIFDAMSCC